MWIAILISVFLSVEVLSYLSGERIGDKKPQKKTV